MASLINGFSKLSTPQKIEELSKQFSEITGFKHKLQSFLHPDEKLQNVFNEFSENTLSNYYLPFGIAPNFLIDGEIFHIPMVIEESSVVAAASYSARFWADQGGFQTEIASVLKPGHIHLHWPGDFQLQQKWFENIKPLLLKSIQSLSENMKKRGGGIVDIKLIDYADKLPHYRQIEVLFDTADAMGANFINSCLEEMGQALLQHAEKKDDPSLKHLPVIIMSILSNYTPESVVKCSVSCNVDALKKISAHLTPTDFAWKFQQAVEIAKVNPFRAATHNKGIFNGIDAVVLATGNDFRAVEANGHTYASKEGYYQGLTNIYLTEDIFTYELILPMALGTVGGLTKLHPLAAFTFEMLGNPSAKKLMSIAASVGLANNFAAIRSLITQGIQKGHMKMHLNNILNQLQANHKEKEAVQNAFSDQVVSYQKVKSFLSRIRTNQNN